MFILLCFNKLHYAVLLIKTEALQYFVISTNNPVFLTFKKSFCLFLKEPMWYLTWSWFNSVNS